MNDADADLPATEPIAVIGLSCRLPGAPDPAAFWTLLCEGRDAIREVPPSRWIADQFYDPEPSKPGKMVTRYGGFLPSIAEFDSLFFGISRREAQRMDPQQRLALELTWEALEDADVAPPQLAGSATGVFFGVGFPEYGLSQLAAPRLMDAYTNTGFVPSMASNRISYVLDFRGPSLAVDTACSSSLTALHLACQSLRLRESTLAIVGGVNLMVAPLTTIGMSRMFALSPRGRCRFLDANADGYGRGEGGGVVVLKRLKSALVDGDPIRAVIRGVAVNQDGRSNGLTAPNRTSQEAVLRAAYRQAGVEPGQMDYVEAHGTGTMLGDPIEMHALGAVISSGRAADRPCRVGSVKTNIGHLESAAGIAGLIKVVLMLQHRQLAPSLHFHEPNPIVHWDRLPMRVQTICESWPQQDRPALAGVSSFGFGGANAHAVVEEFSEGQMAAESDQSLSPTLPLLVFSAKSATSLAELTRRYCQLIESATDAGPTQIRNLCSQAALGRSHFSHRRIVMALDRDSLLADLKTVDFSPRPTAGSRGPTVALVMPHTLPPMTTTQWDWLWSWKQFQSAWTECAAAAGDSLDAVSNIGEARDAKATLALGYVWDSLWRSWGIEPAVTCGLGVGEYTAAAIAGELSLEDAFSAVAELTFDELSPSRQAIAELWEHLCDVTSPRLDALLLCGADRQQFEACRPAQCQIQLLSVWRDQESLAVSFSRTLGALYSAGASINWKEVFTAKPRRRWPLPTYPYQREHCWLPAPFPLFPTGAMEAHRAQCSGENISVGDEAPDGQLTAPTGESIVFSSLLEYGPVAVVWLRGRWCPYSQVILKELQHLAPSIDRRGGKLIAVIPQTTSHASENGDRPRSHVPVFEDVGLAVASAWGLAYELSRETQRSFQQQFGICLSEMHGDGSWRLPQLACHLVTPDRQIAFATALTDCTQPLPLDELLAKLNSLSLISSEASILPP